MTESKGRPTPKRNASQRRPIGPVSPPPTNRKEAAQRLRDQQAAARSRPGGASAARRMMARDAGPIRARVRDIVDGRRNLGVLLLPVALLLLVGRYIGSAAEQVTFVLWVATLIAVAIDLFGTARRIRIVVRTEFPGTKRAGSHVRYGVLRTTVIRQLRQPKPTAPRSEL